MTAGTERVARAVRGLVVAAALVLSGCDGWGPSAAGCGAGLSVRPQWDPPPRVVADNVNPWIDSALVGGGLVSPGSCVAEGLRLYGPGSSDPPSNIRISGTWAPEGGVVTLVMRLRVDVDSLPLTVDGVGVGALGTGEDSDGAVGWEYVRPVSREAVLALLAAAAR